MRRGWKLGQLGGKNPRKIRGTFPAVKSRGRETISRDMRSEKSFCSHLNQQKFICYSLGRENSQGGDKEKCLMPSFCFFRAGMVGKERQSCGDGAGTGKSREELQKFVILTCSEPGTIQP